MDGISFVKQARKIVPDASYIMLSQVSSKDMIASAYEAGIEFFIQKPINSVEVEAVIKKVSDQEQRSDQLFHVIPLLQDLVPDSARVPG